MSLETDEVAELFIDCRDRAYVGLVAGAISVAKAAESPVPGVAV